MEIRKEKQGIFQKKLRFKLNLLNNYNQKIICIYK